MNKMTREEAQSYIADKKIEVGSRGEAVIAKLNEIYGTENPLPDYPFVYILDGQPTWGSSPRKFNSSVMDRLTVDELLDIVVEAPKEPLNDGDVIRVDRYLALVHKGIAVALYDVKHNLFQTGEWQIYDVDWVKEGNTVDRDRFFDAMTHKGFNYSVDKGLRLVRAYGKSYWYLVPDFRARHFVIEEAHDFAYVEDDKRWDEQNYFATKESAEDAVESYSIGL